MKTAIYISGQVSGNFKLMNVIPGAIERRECIFNSKVLIFQTREQAYHALWLGWLQLRRDEPDSVNRIGGIMYLKKRRLIYDASKAEIV